MRIQAKLVKVNTETSVKRLLSKLEKWHLMGYSTDTIIETAIEKQWRGLWLPQGLEPRQKPLTAPRALQGTVGRLVDQTRIPTDESRARAAEARKRAMEILGWQK